MKQKKYEVIFRRFGLDVSRNPDGKLVLGNYEFPEKDFRLEDLKIDEQELFSQVAEIGRIDFRDVPSLKNIRHFEKIDGKKIPWSELENI